jgi:hypothetical protein
MRKHTLLFISVAFFLFQFSSANANPSATPELHADSQTYYYLYYRTSPGEAWRFWQGYGTLQEAQAAEYEVKSYGYETFIKAAVPPATAPYQLHYRKSPQEQWQVWASYKTLEEAQLAQQELQRQGYETFIKE